MEGEALLAEPVDTLAESVDTEVMADEVTTLASVTDTREVVEKYQGMVYGICVTHTKCRSDADDVFQDVFLTYHRKQPRCNSDEHLKAWLITTTINCARRVASSSWRTRVIPLEPQNASYAPQVFRFETDEQNAIFRALGKLPEIYRTALHLFYFEDLSVTRITELLGLESGTVKMRLSRGRKLMRSQLLLNHVDQGLFDE